MWVWIPRFAYKIIGQTIDVKFLIGTTDNYYNNDGTMGTAQRQRTADFISNGNGSLLTWGKALLDETKVTYNESTKVVTANTGVSTKYATIYPYKSSELSIIDTASQNNFANNTKIYGDAVRETTSSNAGTSNTGWNTSAWNSDYSYFPASYLPFFGRGGFWAGADVGSFAFNRYNGVSSYNGGFRAVLVNSSVQ